VLQPIGFDVRTAASGHDCLDLFASGYLPDALLMDLAMPGIDGWETLRRLRVLLQELRLVHPPIAIVSANAFDRGLDNDLGIPSEDFILKPLRHSDLLDWLEQRLRLSWLEGSQAALLAKTQPIEDMVCSDPERLQSLLEVVKLGYYRGIVNQLDAIESAQAANAPFVKRMRELAGQFQFETLRDELQHLVLHIPGTFSSNPEL
jgi:CheY-like chemotaxis protein